MTNKQAQTIAERYLAAMRAITNATTPEERIALRNALIDDPVLRRIYVSPMPA